MRSTLRVILAAAAVVPASFAQRVTTLRSPPRIGSTLSVAYASNPGDGYIMFGSPPFGGQSSIPGMDGQLLLHPALTLLLYTGDVPASGTHVALTPIPDDVALVGTAMELQPINVAAGRFAFGVNEVTVDFSRTGRAVVFQGPSVSTTNGSLEIQIASNQSVGNPGSQGLGSFSVQTIQHYGQEGWVEGYAHSFTGTPFYQDINVHKRNRPARNMATGAGFQSLVLNPRRDLMIARSAANTREFALLILDVGTGQVQLVSGSTLVDNRSTSATPTVMYHSQVAVTDDGNLAAVLVRDDSNLAAASYNRVFLAKTDGGVWTATGNSILDVSMNPAPPANQYFTQTVFFANGRLFVGGSAGWYSCPSDGSSALAPLTLPNTGAGNPNRFTYSPSWRVSRDRRTVVIPIGGNAASSATENDIVSITGISGAGFSVQNVSGFPTATALQRFFGSATNTFSVTAASSVGKRADLSPDGSRVAFLGGNNLQSDPARLYIARTDGSEAGLLAPVTAGRFDPQVVYLGGVEFVTNQTVLFWAGTTHAPATGNVDLYACDVGSGAIQNLTRTTTGSTVPPFTQGGTTGNIVVRSTFKSENGDWLYFVRGDSRTTAVFHNGLVGVNVHTLGLRDITGSEFSGGTAPAIFRGATTRTTDPWVAVEHQLRKSPVGGMAYFAAEMAANASATLYNDANVFGFDMENGGQAVQLTSFGTTGGTTATVNQIQSLVVAPDGRHVAFAMRTGTLVASSEDVFVVPTVGPGVATRMSVSAPGGQTITDGSIQFTGAPVHALVWSVGTGSLTIPLANTVAQWRQIGSPWPPLDLTQAPAAAPPKAVLIHSCNSVH